MATAAWVAGSGQGLTWGNAFSGSELDSLPASKGNISSVAITNGTALDMFADLSINLVSAAFTAGQIDIFLFPLSQDGSTYGDGTTTFSSPAQPTFRNYYVGSIPVVQSTQAQTGSLRGIMLPPGSFKWYFFNSTNVALGTGNTVKYRTYNRSLGGKTEKWVAGSGQGLTWGNAFSGSTLNNLPANDAVLSDIQIDNSSALDMFADLSFLFTLRSGSISAWGFSLMPLNADGTTYGSGAYSTSPVAASPDFVDYLVGQAPMTLSASVNIAHVGTIMRIPIPAGKFKFAIWNNVGFALPASGNTVAYRTYNRSLV